MPEKSQPIGQGNRQPQEPMVTRQKLQVLGLPAACCGANLTARERAVAVLAELRAGARETDAIGD